METIKSIFKYAAIAVAIVLVLIILFVLGYAFLPDIFDPAVARLRDLFSSIPPINIQDSQFINFNMDLELPKIEFNFDNIVGGAEGVSPTFHLSGWMIILGIIAMIVACLHPIAGAIVDVVFCVIGGFLSAQTVSIYKDLVANGTTTWKAAGSCFWPLFAIFIIVFLCGLISVIQTFFNDKTTIIKIIGAILLSVIVSAVASLVATLLVLLVLGLGWAGGIYLFLGLAIALSALLALLGITT